MVWGLAWYILYGQIQGRLQRILSCVENSGSPSSLFVLSFFYGHFYSCSSFNLHSSHFSFDFEWEWLHAPLPFCCEGSDSDLICWLNGIYSNESMLTIRLVILFLWTNMLRLLKKVLVACETMVVYYRETKADYHPLGKTETIWYQSQRLPPQLKLLMRATWTFAPLCYWSLYGPVLAILGTKNGISGARIKILRPLFNTN